MSQTQTMGGMKQDSAPNKGTQGIYGHNPNPGLADPESPSSTPRKFAETGVGEAGLKVNPVAKPQGISQDMRAKLASGSTIDRKKNQTLSQGMTSQPSTRKK